MALDSNKFLLYEGTTSSGTLVAAGRDITMSISVGSVEKDTKDDLGVRGLHGTSYFESISFSGVFTGAAIQETILGYVKAKSINDFYLKFPLVDTDNTTNKSISGKYLITSFEYTGAQNDIMQFSMTLESSGATTHTAES